MKFGRTVRPAAAGDSGLPATPAADRPPGRDRDEHPDDRTTRDRVCRTILERGPVSATQLASGLSLIHISEPTRPY